MRPSLLCLAYTVGVAVGSALPPLGYERKLLLDALSKRQDAGGSCYSGDAPQTKAPKANVWAPISAQDNFDVWTLLHDPATGLNLTYPDDATQSDNYVFWIDTLHTNKTDVLPYLNGDNPEPAKYARAIIFEGGKAEPDSQEYMIGPLPVSEKTTVQKLDYVCSLTPLKAFSTDTNRYITAAKVDLFPSTLDMSMVLSQQLLRRSSQLP